MTESPDLTAARKRIEELERMLDTYSAIDPVDTRFGDEISRLSRQLAMAEAKLREDSPQVVARTTASRMAVHHIDGDATNNSPNNLTLMPTSNNWTAEPAKRDTYDMSFLEFGNTWWYAFLRPTEAVVADDERRYDYTIHDNRRSGRTK